MIIQAYLNKQHIVAFKIYKEYRKKLKGMNYSSEIQI
jgi:hypothetical protein